MQLGPNIWGPHLWKSLHMISIGYPNEPNEEQKKNYRIFFENFYQVIPCSICSNNYKRHLTELPITNDIMKNRQTLAKWVIELHNIVNKEHGKPTMSPDDALLLIFNNFESSHTHEKTIKENVKETSNSSSVTLWSLMVIMFILVAIAVVYKKN
jgi:hypothetical protein